MEQDLPVSIDIYGESECPHTIRLLVNNVKKAINTPDLDKISIITYYAFGIASEKFNESK